eukprot:2675304-Karenia_brevis.AAC.1
MSGDRRKCQDELDAIHEYLNTQVAKFDKALDEDLDDYEKEVGSIEEICQDKLHDLQEAMKQT